MAKKKPARKKKIASKRPILKKKSAAKKKAPVKKSSIKKAQAKKQLSARTKPVTKKKASRKKSASKKSGKASTRARQGVTHPLVTRGRRGLQAASGGQSGDTQGLSRTQYGDSESVEELLEEGQYLEAEAVGGVEDAKDPDEAEVTTSEVAEDDVPREYTDRD
jgi:hypothetical protein